jgi:hypothetical protein
LKQIIFETSPSFVLLCLIVSMGYAFLLYLKKGPWSKTMNRVLFALRTLVVFLISFLLLGPIVKQISNSYEKPQLIILNDDSGSVKEVTDSTALNKIQERIKSATASLAESGYDVSTTNLEGEEITKVNYKATSSDITSGLKKIANRFEGQNIAGVVLLSDGIYNQGISPLYTSFNFPVYTVGVGDTLQRIDLSVKNLAYNKIAYQGNKFPVHVEVMAKGLPNENITVSLSRKDRVIDMQSKSSGKSQLVGFDFEVLANDQGIQKLDIQVERKSQERNIKNNHASLFVEVVEGKKKILVVAPAPHPDIKAIREVIDKNSNYEFLLHIPGLSEQQPSALRPSEIDLAIFLQAPDLKGRTKALFQQIVSGNTSILLQLGQQSDLAFLARNNMPIKFVTMPRDFDEVTPALNSSFSNFILTPENNTIIADYPPVSVFFAKMQMAPNATTLLYQRVGSVTTDKPLVTIQTLDTRKIGILLGEGIWRWRLNEFDKTENTFAFDELFGKLIQYLSTQDDKRKFRSYPLQQQFSDDEPVIFESQAYNDIFEPIYGQSVDIELSDERGKVTHYTYVTSQGNTRYQIGDLHEGIYRYRAKATVNNKPEEVKGEFIVTTEQEELQNLTADFDLLRKLSNNTGGKFFASSKLENLFTDLQRKEAKSIIHSEERFNSIINLKWVFFALLALISAEWFLRKYNGSY